MTSLRQLTAYAFFATTLGLTACEEGCVEPMAPESTGLAGTWQLSDRQCFCLQTTLPNERIVFTDSTFAIYQQDTLARSGRYTLVNNAITCGSTSAEPAVHFVFNPSVGFNSLDAQYTLNGNTLILDYGSPCDAPRNTYKRVKGK